MYIGDYSGKQCKFWDSNIAEMNNNIKGNSQNHNNRFFRFPYLSYSAYGKRSFDISLTQWLLKIQSLKSPLIYLILLSSCILHSSLFYVFFSIFSPLLLSYFLLSSLLFSIQLSFRSYHQRS